VSGEVGFVRQQDTVLQGELPLVQRPRRGVDEHAGHSLGGDVAPVPFGIRQGLVPVHRAPRRDGISDILCVRRRLRRCVRCVRGFYGHVCGRFLGSVLQRKGGQGINVSNVPPVRAARPGAPCWAWQTQVKVKRKQARNTVLLTTFFADSTLLPPMRLRCGPAAGS